VKKKPNCKGEEPKGGVMPWGKKEKMCFGETTPGAGKLKREKREAERTTLSRHHKKKKGGGGERRIIKKKIPSETAFSVKETGG